MGGGGGGGCAAGGADWLGATAVESGSVSGSGSGSRPGVLLRGPGGESCKIGLRPGTARDFFPIASPKRELLASGSREGRALSAAVRNQYSCTATPPPAKSTFNGAARARASALNTLRPPGSSSQRRRAGFTHGAQRLVILTH